MIPNPYSDIYLKNKINIGPQTNKHEAELLIRELGLLYNTLGMIMKDASKILSFKFSGKEDQEVEYVAKNKHGSIIINESQIEDKKRMERLERKRKQKRQKQMQRNAQKGRRAEQIEKEKSIVGQRGEREDAKQCGDGEQQIEEEGKQKQNVGHTISNNQTLRFVIKDGKISENKQKQQSIIEIEDQ